MLPHNDRSRRALVSMLFCFLFECYFLEMHSYSLRKSSSTAVIEPAQAPLVRKEDVEDNFDRKPPTVPQAFADVDFENHFYERYRLSSGKRMELRLKDGDVKYDNPFFDRGWFVYDDVYYTDVTGDRTPEAVVMLSHVQCGGSCDGGAALIYIYAAHKGKLKQLWRYETGSLAYGCGLKSFSIQEKQITLETFGQCWRPATEYPGSGKFVIADVTRSVFRFNGRRFTRRSVEIISRPDADVKNYKAEIRIDTSGP